jgi:hypothetical protein
MGVKRFARHAPGKQAIALGKFRVLRNDAYWSEALPGAAALARPTAALSLVVRFIYVHSFVITAFPGQSVPNNLRTHLFLKHNANGS